MKIKIYLVSTMLCLAALHISAQVSYSVRLGTDGETFTVYMRSSQTYTGNSALIASSQVTLAVPHGVGANSFTLIDQMNLQANMNWSANARVDAPVENLSKDYVSLGFTNSVTDPNSQALFDINAGVEIPLFSFKNGGNCLGAIELIENSDPFNQLPNSANSNPGNSMTVAGVGGEAYIGNYYEGPNDCNDLDGDGVPNGNDNCPNSTFGANVDANGCVDVDGDGFFPDADPTDPTFDSDDNDPCIPNSSGPGCSTCNANAPVINN